MFYYINRGEFMKDFNKINELILDSITKLNKDIKVLIKKIYISIKFENNKSEIIKQVYNSVFEEKVQEKEILSIELKKIKKELEAINMQISSIEKENEDFNKKIHQFNIFHKFLLDNK
jgi:hypothetical protein